MQALRVWLLKPYPFETRWLSGIKNGLWAGLFITFFLFLFKPFGTDVTPGKELTFFMVCSGFGLVTLLITLLINGFCLILPKVFDEEKWVIWKEILFNLFFIGLIGLGNLVLANILWEVPMNGRTFWVWQGFTFAIGVFPTVFGVLLTQAKLSKKYAAEAALMQPAASTNSKTSSITIMGENQNETLTLDPSQIAYLVAQDNYVQVFFFEDKNLRNRLLRATLRKIEDALAERPQFFRCHRTYVVNFDKVEKVSGNAQGYRLHLIDVGESIPVSRNLNDAMRNRLSGSR